MRGQNIWDITPIVTNITWKYQPWVRQESFCCCCCSDCRRARSRCWTGWPRPRPLGSGISDLPEGQNTNLSVFLSCLVFSVRMRLFRKNDLAFAKAYQMRENSPWSQSHWTSFCLIHIDVHDHGWNRRYFTCKITKKSSNSHQGCLFISNKQESEMSLSFWRIAFVCYLNPLTQEWLSLLAHLSSLKVSSFWTETNSNWCILKKHNKNYV